MREVPKWIEGFYQVIEKYWEHHSPCEHVNMYSEWIAEGKSWHVYAAPVFQEILGGEDDGKQIWAGFLFDFGNFSRHEGIWIQEQAFLSACVSCNQIPKTMTIGKYKGHRFYLHILFEPPKETKAIEMIDAVNGNIITVKNDEEE